MIVVKIFSGLGNQLFQYAAGRYLSEKLNTELYIDISDYNEDNFRQFKLDVFNTKYQVIDDLKSFKISIFLNRYRISRNLNNFFGSYKYYYSTIKTYDSYLTKIKDNTYVDGYFQSYDHVKNVAEQMKIDLKIKSSFLPITSNSKIENSIAIHVRRTDYLNNPLFEPVELSFYINAIKLVDEVYPNLYLSIFTDDIFWVKREFIMFESDRILFHQNSDIVDFYLMQQCKSFIIPNSTFSWWAAFLGESEDKITICPKFWFKGTETGNMVPKNWIKINNS